MKPTVKVVNLTQYIHNQPVLNEVSFETVPGEMFVLFGPSGAGKTTLISILAGIQTYTSGNVEVCDQRQTGLVTQEYSLFPQLTVKENLQIIGMMQGMASRNLMERFETIVENFHLGNVLNRRVGRIPWGPRQRLALGCAMLSRPALLLVDDILHHGDIESTRIIVENVTEHVNQGHTCIWATSRSPEALNLASTCQSRIGLLENQQLTTYQVEEFIQLLQEHGVDQHWPGAGW